MIHRIAERIINWQVIRGNITEEEKNKYIYSYEILLNQVINLSIALILGLILCELKAVIFFLVIYIPLRRFAGGFHAKTNERCIIYSSLLVVCVIILNKMLRYYAHGYENIMAICSVLLLVCVCCIAPVEAQNKKLEVEEKKRYRRKVHLICLIHIFVMVLNVLILKKQCISVNILLGYFVLCILLIITFKKQKQKCIS